MDSPRKGRAADYALYARRAYPREYYEAPVMYAKYNMKACCDATMYYCREGGMYFESCDVFQPGAFIYIKMINFSPDVYVPGDYKTYMAKVIWCKKLNGANTYGTGVRHTIKGYLLKGENIRRSGSSCELCGENLLEEVHKTEDTLYLCLDCFRHLGRLDNGKIKESILKFLIGNVF